MRYLRIVPKRARKIVRRFQARTYVYNNQVFFRSRAAQSGALLRTLGNGVWGAERHISVARQVGPNFTRFRKNLTRPTRVVTGVYGNFGNQVLEALCAVQIAKTLGIPRVVLDEAGIFRNGRFCVSGVELIAPEKAMTKATARVFLKSLIKPANGDFDLCGAFMLNWLEAPYALPDMKRILKDLRDVIDVDLSGEPPVSEHITASFRGGDAFSENPPSHYGQPPVSFYKKAILSHDWEKIYVVSDDGANPGMRAFLEWAEKNGLPCEYRRQGWRADVQLVYRSPNVIAPRGSFIPAVCALSPFTKKMWHFGPANWPIPQEKVHIVADIDGKYTSQVLGDAWSASPNQIRQMLEYPIDLLSEEER